ncbi:hypothetical protein FB471_6297 [Amycolatopsis cihanbeyliensis]|uniref:Uncharacterized protein n=1 Tax=Amycolatopsis cihanbeyliensis TaxID=1128664 RepID=A0A542CTJ5_AMYCI|nr:hypothetical protein FB471_6297 [Amycolatopsis cihanbeyliensis]
MKLLMKVAGVTGEKVAVAGRIPALRTMAGLPRYRFWLSSPRALRMS